MSDPSDVEADPIPALEVRIRGGDESALATLFEHCRPRLLRMIDLRLDPRMRHRLDPEDILQEVFLDARKRIASFAEQPDLGGYLWLRLVAGQTMIDIYRRHLGAQRRTMAGEVRLNRRGPAATSETISIQLAANMSSPSHVAMRAEHAEALRQALDKMDEIDREVLVLRHFEELTNGEVAAVLGLQKTAASNRYIRALERLRGLIGEPEDGPGPKTP